MFGSGKRIDGSTTCGEQPIDLVITDYHMPIMGGIALIQWMDRNQYHIPTMVLSGEMPEDIQPQITSPNVFAILTKPYPFPDLYLKIQKVFNTPECPFSEAKKTAHQIKGYEKQGHKQQNSI